LAIYSLGNRTTATGTATPAQEIIAGSNLGYRLLELGITINAATASVFGFGRPAATGVTPTSPQTVLAEDGGNTATGNTTTALAWGTAPTVPANFFRRCSLAAAIGAGIIWTFPRGIITLKTLSTVIWNPQAGSNSVADTWVVVDE
jgi:hypothetical protein